MHRIDSATAEEDTHGSGKDGFTSGNPGGGVPPTGLTADWFNDVQEELANVIESNGVTLVKGDNDQLLTVFRSPVGTAGNPAINATGGSSSATGLQATGGAPNGNGLQGNGSGTGRGISGFGGSGGGTGVYAEGGGSSGIGLNAVGAGTGNGITATGGATNGNAIVGTGGGSGSGVRGVGGSSGGTGIHGTGGGSTGLGVVGVGAGSGSGVQGTGGATGIGVRGIGTDGYGVSAQSTTTSPTKAAFRIVPQDANPSNSPAMGDIYVHSSTGKPRVHNGTAFERVITQDGESTADSSSINGSSEAAFDVSHSIPANTLVAGSTIRIRALVVAFSSSTNVFDYRVRIGGVSGTIVGVFVDLLGYPDAENPGDVPHMIDVVVQVRSTGASGAIVAGGFLLRGLGDAATTHQRAYGAGTNEALTINTTIANSVVVTVDNTTGDASHVLSSLVVDVA